MSRPVQIHLQVSQCVRCDPGMRHYRAVRRGTLRCSRHPSKSPHTAPDASGPCSTTFAVCRDQSRFTSRFPSVSAVIPASCSTRVFRLQTSSDRAQYLSCLHGDGVSGKHEIDRSSPIQIQCGRSCQGVPAWAGGGHHIGQSPWPASQPQGREHCPTCS